MRVGIIGSGKDKFTPETEAKAREIIRKLLPEGAVLVSGHSPMGGIDIWAEEEARVLERPMEIFAPKVFTWSGKDGYRDRNLDIASTSDVVHVIVPRLYPQGYDGMSFKQCYHCERHCSGLTHVKSGACWTAWEADRMGKETHWHVI
jgi:hypothetical protein